MTNSIQVRVLFLILSCFLSFSLVSQEGIRYQSLSKKEQKEFKKIRKKIQEKDFEKALKSLAKFEKKQPNLVDIYTNRAYIFYQNEDYQKTVKELQKAITLAPESDPKIYLSLATAHRKLGEYTDAIAAYQNYHDRINDEQKQARASRYMDECRFIMEALANPVPFDPKPLDPSINTSESEYLPLFTLDGSQLFFTRKVLGQEDIYFAKSHDSTFTDVDLVPDINSVNNEGAHTISGDGNTIIFTACNRSGFKGGCDLFYSRKNGENWSKPQNLASINTRYWEGHPSLSADGYSLYFSSDRPGGSGNTDIWVSQLEGNRWSEPTNLGDTINTQGHEESPFIHADGRSLYFRSNGHIGMGNFDLFMSRKSPQNEEWASPKNLGYPINSEYNDGALSIDLSGSRAYFASDRSDDIVGQKDDLDIFYFDIPKNIRPQPMTYLKIKVIDKNDKQAISAKLHIASVDDSSSPKVYPIFKNGEIVLPIDLGQEYSVQVEKKDYILQSKYVQVDSQALYQNAPTYLIELEKISTTKHSESEPIVLENIFFESGSAILKSSSYTEIDVLAKMMSQSETIKLTIMGHTDNIGSHSDNFSLSKDRAKAVYDALIDRGINHQRLSYVGKGESEPIDDNDTESGRSRNRRTEFVINYD